MTDIVNFGAPRLPDPSVVLRLVAREGISQIYNVQVTLLITHPTETFDRVLDSRAGVVIMLDGATAPEIFHGIIVRFEQLAEWDGGVLVAVEIEPALQQLTRSRHSRIFVDQSPVDVIGWILDYNGFGADDFELRLEQTYPAREYICQYEESDYAFIARWMQREGLYFVFEQGSGSEKLIITDTLSFATSLRSAPVAYLPRGTADAMTAAGLSVFRRVQAARAGWVRVDDDDPANPPLELNARFAVSGGGRTMLNHYGTHHHTPEDAKRLAVMRAEALVAHADQCRARGRAAGLHAGFLFSLDGHPRAEFNRGYLVTEAVHCFQQAAPQDLNGLPDLELPQGGGAGGYEVQLTSIHDDVPYRALTSAPWPKISGYTTATVDGPAESDYAQLDAAGRYKVRLHCDERSHDDGHASAWIRMLQPHAGEPEGLHLPLRKGTEVLLIFLDGDPDRPVIAGAVPNALTPSPVTEDNASKNIIQSGGGNRIVMQDRGPYVDVSSPTKSTSLHLGHPHGKRHQEHVVLRSEGDAAFLFGDDFDVEVGTKEQPADHYVRVTGNVMQNYGHDLSSTVGTWVTGDRMETVQGSLSRQVVQNETINVEANRVLDIAGVEAITALQRHVEVRVSQTFRATDPFGFIALTVSGAEVTVRDKAVQLEDGAGARIALMNGDVIIESAPGGKVQLLCNGASVTLSGGNVDIQASPIGKVNLVGGPTVNINGPGLFDARVGDPAPTAVLRGSSTVLVGGTQFPMDVTFLENGDIQVGNNITILHDDDWPDFATRTLGDLGVIASTESGRAELAALDASLHTVTIEMYAVPLVGPPTGDMDIRNGRVAGQNGITNHTLPESGNGTGSDARISYNPEFRPINSLDPNNPEPADAVLYHELGHAQHAVSGTVPCMQDAGGNWVLIPAGGLWTNTEEVNTITPIAGLPSENVYLIQRGYGYLRTAHVWDNWTPI